MSTSPPSASILALNAVLSEVIDVVQELKQARQKVSQTHELYPLLDGLFSDLRKWAELLMDYDSATGEAPLSIIMSAAGRKPPNLWPRGASDGEVRDLVVGHLDRLEQHDITAIEEQESEAARQVLASVQEGVLIQKRLFSELAIRYPDR